MSLCTFTSFQAPSLHSSKSFRILFSFPSLLTRSLSPRTLLWLRGLSLKIWVESTTLSMDYERIGKTQVSFKCFSFTLYSILEIGFCMRLGKTESKIWCFLLLASYSFWFRFHYVVFVLIWDLEKKRPFQNRTSFIFVYFSSSILNSFFLLWVLCLGY